MLGSLLNLVHVMIRVPHPKYRLKEAVEIALYGTLPKYTFADLDGRLPLAGSLEGDRLIQLKLGLMKHFDVMGAQKQILNHTA